MENESKLRLLYTGEILLRQTDEDHPLSTSQIIDILRDEYGVSAHRTTVANDVDALREFGYDICKIESTQNKFFVANRDFEMPELRLLMDAVASSKFMTEKKRKKLEAKICTLASAPQAAELKSSIYVEPPAKADNEKIYYIIDTINEAIRLGKKIAFQYFHYDANKCRALKNNGEVYLFSPYTLVWNGDFYYAVGFSDKHGDIGSFRVERIADIPQILEENSVPQPEDFEISGYLRTLFRMFNSEEREISLICRNETMDSVIDHFGLDIPVVRCGENHFSTKVVAHVSPIFFRWVFGFGGDIIIEGPDEVKEMYMEMLKSALEKN